ncbi:hypothetical protein [Corynebacterium sp.]|uniref:hypothetical protein n=1 Tax=Corynebacterium sp. TaxID=1720 RepID=UPI002A90AD5E|nr:hypothetical protein [Corynebacterium sp.]MDY5785132.1 hypothetical protein [Corynebacterium sp.]
MNLMTARLALSAAGSALGYFRSLDDKKQREVYDAIVDAIKNDDIDSIEDLADVPELEGVYNAARAEAGDITRSSRARLARRRTEFDASAPLREARIKQLKAEAKANRGNSGAAKAAAILAGAAALGGIGWAVYTFLVKDRLGTNDDITFRPMAPRTETDERGNATLVYSTTTEDDREARVGSAGPLGEEPAERDEELLSSIDAQLSTLDTLDDDQRRGTR